ncbi:hypothetical protein ACVWW7_003438 [Bradyrhizobium sp. LM6.9]
MIGSSALMRNPPHKSLPPAPDVQPDLQPDLQPDDNSARERRAANLEMARVLKTQPLRMASDSQSGAIAYWKHEALHDIVEPMADHVIMAYPAGSQALERRTGKTVAIATARAGVVTIIPAGSTSRWDIHRPLHVVQLYLPQRTLLRIADEANTASPDDLLERTGHPDAITSRLLLSAADSLEGSATLDTLLQAAIDGSSRDAPVGRPCRRAGHAAADYRRPFAGGPAPGDRTPAFGQRCGCFALGACMRRRPVAFPFLPILQGEHRALAACLAAPAPARAGHEHAAEERRIGRLGRRCTRLFLADRLRRGIQEADGRNAERLAQARALAAIPR